MSLSDAAFAQYQREGYVVVEDLLPAARIEELTGRVREYVTGEREVAGFERMLEPDVERDAFDAAGDPVRKFEGVGMARSDDVFRALAFDEDVLEVATRLLGPDLLLHRCAAMLKPPGVGSAKKFHQDAAYYPVHPMDHLTVWIALDEATTENGCMQVVPGAHTDGLLAHVAEDYATDITLAESDYGPEDAVALPMSPGDALFQHCLLPHYTAPNESDRWRRAMILSYMGSRSRLTTDDPPPWFDTLHVAGETYPGCLDG